MFLQSNKMRLLISLILEKMTAKYVTLKEENNRTKINKIYELQKLIEIKVFLTWQNHELLCKENIYHYLQCKFDGCTVIIANS